MALYELRTYTLHVGKMAEAVKLYQEIGFPELRGEAFDEIFVRVYAGPMGATVGVIIELPEMYKLINHARVALEISVELLVLPALLERRPLLMTQEVKLLHPAPWGPHP
jgi:hypothetical protein